MSGVVCVIILEGNKAQGAAAQLSQNIAASCQLVDYLENDDDLTFNAADAKPISEFHERARKVIGDLNVEINKLNADLAKKYDRTIG